MRITVPVVAWAAIMLAGPANAQMTDAELWRHENASAVASTERAFDAFTAEHGFTAGFLEFAAPDGILFRPDPVNARDFLSARPVSTDTQLRWGPARVGVGASGDLAWDTGPWSYGDEAHGWFFTIWARQPDGRWRWILDHGSGSNPVHQPVPNAPDVIVDRAGVAVGEEGGWTQVQSADTALNGRLTVSGAAAYDGLLADDAWVNTPDAGPAMASQAVSDALSARPDFQGFEPLGGSMSRAGDLAWTYGALRWREDDADRRGHYIRVWRRDAPGEAGWHLVYDQVSPVPQS